MKFQPLRDYKKSTTWKPGDTLAIFGEVFERGYVNGLIDEAKHNGMNVIYGTVGRRETDMTLRKLTNEEIQSKNQTPIINVPLEAGFDLEKAKNGVSPVDQLKEYGLTGWEDAKLDWSAIQDSQSRGIERFRAAVQNYLQELEKHVQSGKNLLIAHTMAGGFPRAKVVMPIANKIFKGSGPRYQSSEVFWNSEIGKLCALSFNEVTAETLKHLVELSAPLRKKVTDQGGQFRILAYGYHGNETLIGNEYKWFSYSPYLQGWAKCRMEEIADESSKAKVTATVFNVPEILTNSSSIFLGIEVALYSLIQALRKTAPQSRYVQNIIQACQKKLKPEFTIDQVIEKVQEYFRNPIVQSWPKFEGWPQHNGPEQMEMMKKYSSEILAMHISEKDLLTAELSEIIFKATGKVMLHESAQPRHSVAWIGHDLVAKVATEGVA